MNTDFKIKNCLFGCVKLTNNAYSEKCKYSGWGIEFCLLRIFIYRWKGGKNVIIFGADMSSSIHIDDKNKDILIFIEVPSQGWDDKTLTAEAKYPKNFTQPRKRFVLSLHYNGINNFLFVNATKIYQFKVEDSEI